MKSLFVLTCLVAVCFVATNAASVDTALRNLLEALEKRHGPPHPKPCDAGLEDGDACDVSSGAAGSDGKCTSVGTHLPCIKACSADSDCVAPDDAPCYPNCPLGKCNVAAGVCRPPPGKGGACSSADTTCPPNHVCDEAEGRCKRSCTDDDDCRGPQVHVCTNSICEKPAVKRSLMDDLKEMVKKWQ